MRIGRLFLYGLMAIATVLSVAQQKAKYLVPDTPIEDRIDDLLRRMTIDEKVSQIVDSWGSAGIQRLNVPALLKTEGLHSQSYSTGACTAAPGRSRGLGPGHVPQRDRSQRHPVPARPITYLRLRR